MGYRYRLTSVVRYGHFNDIVSGFHELNEIAESRGWPQGRLLAPFVGAEVNEISFETDYPDLATYERVTNEFFADAEAMKVWRGMAEFTFDRSSRDMLYVDAPTLA